MSADPVDLLAVGLVSLLAGLLVALLVLTSGILRRLRERHPGAFAELGEPGLLWSQSIRSSSRVTRFVWTRSVRDLGDDVLLRRARWLRAIHVLYTLLFLVALGAFLFAVVVGAPATGPGAAVR